MGVPRLTRSRRRRGDDAGHFAVTRSRRDMPRRRSRRGDANREPAPGIGRRAARGRRGADARQEDPAGRGGSARVGPRRGEQVGGEPRGPGARRILRARGGRGPRGLQGAPHARGGHGRVRRRARAVRGRARGAREARRGRGGGGRPAERSRVPFETTRFPPGTKRPRICRRSESARAQVEAARKLEETEGPKRRRSSMLSMLGGSGKGDDEEEDPPEPPKTLVVVFDTLARCSVARGRGVRSRVRRGSGVGYAAETGSRRRLDPSPKTRRRGGRSAAASSEPAPGVGLAPGLGRSAQRPAASPTAGSRRSCGTRARRTAGRSCLCPSRATSAGRPSKTTPTSSRAR